MKDFVFVAVDRVQKGIAMLEADDGRRFEVSVKSLSHRPREGMVYRVSFDAGGTPHWSDAVADPAEAARRREELTSRMDRRRRADRGGDVGL